MKNIISFEVLQYKKNSPAFQREKIEELRITI